MGETLTASAGFASSWEITLRDGDGAPVPILDGDSLDATVWPGDDRAPSFSPAIAAADADNGVVALSVSASQAASVDPGTYRLVVGLTSGGARVEGFDGHLAIEGGPGTGVARKVYGSADDLLLWYDQAGLLANLGSDQAGFLEERAEARDLMIRHWVDGYRPRGGFVRVRGTTWSPIYGFDRPDATRVPPTRDQLEAWLLGDRLAIDEGARKVASLLAIAILLERQEVRGANPYRAEASVLRDKAMDLLCRHRLRIDTTTSPDGVADLEIASGSIVTYLEAP